MAWHDQRILKAEIFWKVALVYEKILMARTALAEDLTAQLIVLSLFDSMSNVYTKRLPPPFCKVQIHRGIFNADILLAYLPSAMMGK